MADAVEVKSPIPEPMDDVTFDEPMSELPAVEETKDIAEVVDETDKATEATETAEVTAETPETLETTEKIESGEEVVDETETAEETETQSEPQFSRELLEHAAQFGITEQDAKSLGSPEALDHSLAVLGRVLQKGPIETPKSEDTQTTDDEFALKLPEFNADDFDPAVVEAFNQVKAMHEHYKTRIGRVTEMESSLKQVTDVLTRIQQQSETKWFDDQVSELSMVDVYGEGPTAALSESSEQFKNRKAVYDEAAAIAAGYTVAGRDTPTDIVQRAARSVHGKLIQEKAAKAARTDISKQVKKRSSQLISRPSQKTGEAALTADQRALRAISTWKRDHGTLAESELDVVELES